MNRLLVLFGSLAFICDADASGKLGTRSGGGFTPLDSSVGLGIGPMIQMLIALGIVIFLLKWLLPKIADKWFSQNKSSRSGLIKIVESSPLGNAVLHLIDVDGNKLLVATHSQGVTLMTSISHPSPLQDDSSVQTSSTRTIPSQKLTSNLTFEEVLSSEESTPPLYLPSIDAHNALTRLERLTL